MKRIYSTILFSFYCLAFALFSSTFVFAEDLDSIVVDSGTCGDNLTWEVTASGVLTISGTGDMDDYEMSKYVPWCEYRDYLTDVIIEKGVTSIGSYGLYDVSAETITIPDSVTSIGDNAFAFVETAKIEIPSSVTKLGEGVFECCQSEEIIISANITEIPDKTFYSSDLVTITLPKTITTIGEDAFKNNIYLSIVYFGGTVSKWKQINIEDGNNGSRALGGAIVVCSDGACRCSYTSKSSSWSMTEVDNPYEYTYNVSVINPYCDLYNNNNPYFYDVYIPIGVLIYVETDNPDASSFSLESTNDVSSSFYPLTADMFPDLNVSGAVSTQSGSGCVALAVDGGYIFRMDFVYSEMTTVSVEVSGIEIEGASVTFEVQDYETAYDEWLDEIIEASEIDDSMTNREKLSALCNYISENYTYYTNDGTYIVMQYSEYGTHWQNHQLDSRTTPRLIVSLADRLGIENVTMITTDSSDEDHAFAEYVEDGVTYYYTADSVSSSTGYIDTGSIKTISMNKVTATDGTHSSTSSGVCSRCGAELTSIKQASVSLSSSNTYTGEEVEPSATVKLNGKTLEKDVDYAMFCENNVDAGTAKVLIQGIGKYGGTIKKTFTISPFSISSLNCDVGISENKNTYDGSKKYVLTSSYCETIESTGYIKLSFGKDCSVSYSNNINAGTATVTVKGIGNYTGTLKKTFTIESMNISANSSHPAVITLSKTSYTYDGTAKKPTPTVKVNGKTLTKGTDYTVSYEGNTTACKGKITITGIGNYKGTKSKYFTIAQKSISSSSAKATVSFSASSYAYTGSSVKPSPTVKITLNGKRVSLKKGTDYTVSYKNNKKRGTATVTITGTGNYKGTVTGTFKITKQKLKSARITLSSAKLAYNGKTRTPSVTVKNSLGTKLTKGTDYTIKYSSSSRKKIGTYTVTITGKGNYTGTVTKTFKIVPKKVTVSSTKSSTKKKITVKWKKSSVSVTKYQIRYRIKGTSTWKTVTVAGSKSSAVLKNLKSGKTYQIQVRAYKTVSKTKYYGKWSTVAKVKVK